MSENISFIFGFLFGAGLVGFGSFLLLSNFRKDIDRLREEKREFWEEIKQLRDSFLMKNGAAPIHQPPLPPPAQRDVSTPYDQWMREDIKREIVELNALAEQDPESFGPILEDALLRYKEELKQQ